MRGESTIIFQSFPNEPLFLRVCRISVLKTLWEKEKLLLTGTFPFSHSFFFTFLENFLSSYLKLSSANSFSLEESKIWERVKYLYS